jgi:hypothetical protein
MNDDKDLMTVIGDILNELDEGYGGLPVDYEPPEESLNENVTDTSQLDELVNQDEIVPGVDEGYNDFDWIDDNQDVPIELPFPSGDGMGDLGGSDN